MLEGTWDSIFEFLNQLKRLSSFKTEHDTYLFHHGGVGFWTDKYQETFRPACEKVVVIPALWKSSQIQKLIRFWTPLSALQILIKPGHILGFVGYDGWRSQV